VKYLKSEEDPVYTFSRSNEQSPVTMRRHLLLLRSLASFFSWVVACSAAVAVVREDKRQRHLQTRLPAGVTLCEEFFGRSKAFGAPTDQQPFCVNGGFCKHPDLLRQDPANPCECLDGFVGSHCEFELGVDAVPTSCQLDCGQGGVCRIGAPSWKAVVEQGSLWHSTNDKQYCECQDGYTGDYCEKKGVTCGSIQCFHGGTCVHTQQTDGTVTDHCDCTSANHNDKKYAGLQCEHELTEHCSTDHYNGHQFCVNGGTCKGES
jgi:hypothetical protein